MAGNGYVTCSVCRLKPLDHSSVAISTLDTTPRSSSVFICVLITKHLAPQNHRVPGYLSEPYLPVGCYIVLSYLLSTWYL